MAIIARQRRISDTRNKLNINMKSKIDTAMWRFSSDARYENARLLLLLIPRDRRLFKRRSKCFTGNAFYVALRSR